MQDLEKNYQELLTFFNAMDEVFFSVNASTSAILQISRGCETLYGFPPEAFKENNRLRFELIHPDDKHLVSNQDDLLKQGAPIIQQYRIVTKDGRVRWVENKLVPALNYSGELLRIDGITRDITERKQAGERHRLNKALYRQIVESAQEGIWTIDVNDKTNYVNQKICDILGYTAEEMMGKELYDFMDEEGKAYAIACMEKRRNGSKDNLDIRYKTKNGQDVWANISANPIFDGEGQYAGALAMITDITRRREDEEQLKKSEANLRTIFDNTDSSYILFGADLRIISFNVLAQKHSLELNDRELAVNDHLSHCIAAERWPLILDILEKVAAGETVNYEVSFTRKDGFVRWSNIRWLNIQNNENKNWGFILANKDITEIKLASLERERIAADLIQHVKDLEQFTYIISHNLRAPVANIIGLAELLKEPDMEPDDQLLAVERVSQSVKNIDVVIQDLNQILQTRELGNEKKEVVYFAEIVSAIKTSIANIIVSEHVKFECDFKEADQLSAIRSYIYSIFYNLASNSIKYCQPGVAPVISIVSKKLPDKIELRFKDNGKGIDLDKHSQHLFGLYKRFDSTVEGKGMGLFMVKTQVEALGGTININSTVGVGTEFIIQLAL